MIIAKWSVITIFFLCLLQVGIILYDGLIDDMKKSHVALVLGNKVNKDGTVSERLKSRLDKSIELYRQKYYDKIIVSGGLGREGHDEAVVMRAYLIKNSIDSTHIIVDSDGVNTYKSSLFADSVMTVYNWNSVLVITNYYHIRRSKLALANRGIEHIYSAHAEYFELRDVYSVLREVPAYVKYLWK